MIVSRIDGGLGNQMFQYAYGYYLARKHRCPLWLDITTFDSQPPHGYMLDRFRIGAGVAGEEVLDRLPLRYRPQGGRGRTHVLIRGLNFFSRKTLRRHKESPFGFQPRHLRVPDERYLVGYWQSEQFFPGLRDELLEQFGLRQHLSTESQAIQTQIRASNSLAIHVRRGDYVTNPAAAKLYCQLEPEYYHVAIDEWGRRQAASDRPVEVFVFSNDVAWCREHLSFHWKTNFIDHNTAATAHEDLILMSQAQCCVISNSTFSWWAAWLNQRIGRAIYAPRQWFRPGTLDGTHIVPQEWQLV